MFLVPFNKKSFLGDSTLSSQQKEQQQQQQVRSSETKSGTNSSFYGAKSSDDNQCRRFNEQILTLFIDGTTSFIERCFIKSLAALKRWLNFSIRALLAILQPIFSTLPEIPLTTTPRIRLESNRQEETVHNNRLTWNTPPAILFTSELEYLNALTERQQDRCIARSAVAVSEISLANISANCNLFLDNTITDCGSMDLCRRKSARHSASNNTRSDGSFDNNSASRSSYWQFLPSALAHIAGTSSGLAHSASRPLEQSDPIEEAATRKQRTPADAIEFQGQQLQQPRRRRSCGLQTGTSSSVGNSSGMSIEPEDYLSQHQLSQDSQQDIQIPPRGQSVCAAPGLISALHDLQQQQHLHIHRHMQKLHSPEQQQQRENNNNNNSSAMNYNAQKQYNHNHNQQQRQHQQCSRLDKANNEGHAQMAGGESGEASMVLVSKNALNSLTDQIAFSMNKMKHLEEQVRVIPELQRRLDHVLVVRTNDGGNAIAPDAANYLQQQHLQQQQHQQMQCDQIARLTLNNNSGRNNSLSNHNNSLVNIGLRRRSNTNIGSNDDIMTARVVHPSLQRHYNSFRQYSANKAEVQQRDAISYRRSPTANRLSTRSPTTTRRDYNGAPQVQVLEHLNDRFGSGGSTTTTNTSGSISPHQSIQFSPLKQSSACKSNHQDSINDVTSQKSEYQELINDLISLSYSVNYQSPSNSNSVQSSASSGRNSRGLSKTADSSPLHQALANHRHQEILAASPALHHNNANITNGNSKRHFSSSSMEATKLDCGCQSFKEHLRYNSISREQRLNNNNNSNSRSRSSSATTINQTPVNLISPNHTPMTVMSHKVDASTNTELSMDDIVTKVELDNMVTSIQKTYSTLSSIASRDDHTSNQFTRVILRHQESASKHLPTGSPTTSGDSFSDPKSSATPPDSIESSDSCGEDDRRSASECSSNKGIVDEEEMRKSSISDDIGDDEADDDSDDEEAEYKGDRDARSPSCGEPYSLGSSYQDPSDFEEYCAYGESLDRRTKDFMSQTTKIPNDLRFALIRLNDFIKRKHSFEQIESSSGCVEVIRKEWFKVAANKDSQVTKTKLYVDYFESFTKQLLNSVVNLSDSAGNTAMHYAASHNKLDIIKVLLDTKVCDINRRNKAGYTPIMLLALADIEKPDEQEIARHLFSLGDVNIKARTSGQTAIMLAASHGRLATVKLLLECGADPSMQDYDGSTALMCGSEMGHEEVVKCLLAHKLTDPNETDNDGLDALTIAMNNGHKNIGLILYAAKNVPRMVRSTMSIVSNNNNNNNGSNKNDQTFIYQHSAAVGGGGYLGASLRRSRGKLATNFVKRADSLLSSRTNGIRPAIRNFVDS